MSERAVNDACECKDRPEKPKSENTVTLRGGHYDGKTIVVDPAENKLVLDWAEVHDYVDHAGAEYGDLAVSHTGQSYMVTDRFMDGGTTTGQDTYRRNPANANEFLFDDGKDYRLACYWLEELRAECRRRREDDAVRERKALQEVKKAVDELLEIVGPGLEQWARSPFGCGEMKRVSLSTAVANNCASAHTHPTGLIGDALYPTDTVQVAAKEDDALARNWVSLTVRNEPA